MKKTYSVKEVCDQTGLKPKLLFDYEQQGIVMPIGRRTRGYVDGKGNEYKGYKEYDEGALLKFHQG